MGTGKIIIGLGNVLWRDEGVGVRAIEYLRGKHLEDIELLDGGTRGFDLLEEIKKFQKVVIVDAVDMGKEPGHIASFDAEHISSLPCREKFSLHEIGLIDILRVGKEIGYNFAQVRIVGIQPKDISRGDGLSEALGKKLPSLAERALKELAN